MTSFLDKVFTRYPIKTKRSLEILIGVLSWSIILSPIWASLLFPLALAYFILFFDVYWLYKSFWLVITSYIASNKIKVSERENWLAHAVEQKSYEKTKHIVIIPNYKESAEKLRETILTLAKQTLPTNKIFVVLGMEEREEKGKEKANILINEFKNKFAGIYATFHPDIKGEVKGKSSNEAFAAKTIYKKLIKGKKIDEMFTTISSVDADSIFDSQYFAYLTNSFLLDKNRYNKFWQSANVQYNNIWEVPAPVRIVSFFGSLYRTALLVQGDRLVSNSTYSLSLKLLVDIGFWDTDVIPEDYRIFFKAFFKKGGNIFVEPIFLKTSLDAPQSTSLWKTLRNKYDQERRWSWGISDDPLFIKWWLTVPNVSLIRKTTILFHVILDHLLWPVSWFIITLAANIIPFINPVFSRTTLGYRLPQLAGIILTCCLFGTLSMIVIDFRNRGDYKKVSKVRKFLFPLEFIYLPIVGFFLSALPAIISHTQLILGKRIEYKVTEKV